MFTLIEVRMFPIIWFLQGKKSRNIEYCHQCWYYPLKKYSPFEPIQVPHETNLYTLRSRKGEVLLSHRNYQTINSLNPLHSIKWIKEIIFLNSINDNLTVVR